MKTISTVSLICLLFCGYGQCDVTLSDVTLTVEQVSALHELIGTDNIESISTSQNEDGTFSVTVCGDVVSATVKTAIETFTPAPKYDPQTVETALFQAFSAGLSSFKDDYSIISSCLKYGNATSFTVLKMYCDSLVSAGQATAQDYATFKLILLGNGINLDDYAE
jgi:hypothetical protein